MPSSPRLRPARRLAAVPTPPAMPMVWLAYLVTEQLAPAGAIQDAQGLLVPAGALLHPEAGQPEATRLYELLPAPAAPGAAVRVVFLADVAEQLAAQGLDWHTAGLDGVYGVLFEVTGLAAAELIDHVRIDRLDPATPLLINHYPADIPAREQLRGRLQAELAQLLPPPQHP